MTTVTTPLNEGDLKVRTTNNPLNPPPLRLPGSSRAIASPFILYNMTIPLPTFWTLMWGGGAGTPALVLPPIETVG
ncbi:uncharacterized protein LACBIDRAFT_299135 [Laccaria bicolor S238N-H82]|uniref:Predicted protein n=1 Tax=Laccaria bicolor (strain S238N-H82 / ATCC MYA-4686) TaxID=486041 RepID=B0DE54_LACBS|nr:uncharacterized protein LACBIDRAFT_299135 [Laccaria bicolor S238N-H82]EDR07329.1 predicted protein [Laccaria bicolor S238N-H82]|eukprot:XP_001882260.1 predicted protein [Laccaria bicolor S238N-H82]